MLKDDNIPLIAVNAVLNGEASRLVGTLSGDLRCAPPS